MEIIKKVFEIFNQRKKKVYLVGGSVRDYLLNNQINDYDFCSPLTPSSLKNFLNSSTDKFSEKFGTFLTLIDNKEIQITTLRKEGKYLDYRHPSSVKFIKSLYVDSKRRDFTINALYLDQKFKIHDFHKGLKDLKNKTIKMIGNPDKRIKEDPIRILRALRFKLEYDFVIDSKLDEAIKSNINLLKHVSKERLNNELSKFKLISKQDKINDLLKSYNIELL